MTFLTTCNAVLVFAFAHDTLLQAAQWIVPRRIDTSPRNRKSVVLVGLDKACTVSPHHKACTVQ